MAFESGPDSRVLTPGAKDNEESRDVANVNVTNRRFCSFVVDAVEEGAGGRRGSRLRADAAENVSVSGILNI